MLFVILMNCCFAAALPLIKYALVYVNPFFLVTLRMLGAGFILCGFQACYQPYVYRQRLNWPLLTVNGLLSMGLLCTFEAWALQGMSATKANLMWATLPVLTALATRIWNKQPLYTAHAAAIGLGCLGIMFLITPELLVYGISTFSSSSVWHDIAMLMAVTAAACGYICTEQLVKEHHPIIMSNGVSMLIGGLLSLVVTAGLTGPSGFVMNDVYKGLGCIALMIASVNMVGLSLQMWLTRTHSVILLALSSFIPPLCGGIFGLMQGDVWDCWLLGATLCIGSGLGILHYYDTTKPVGND